MASAESLADLLVQGPRGRQFLLEYALRSDRAAGTQDLDDSLSSGDFFAAHHLDPATGTGSVALFTAGADADDTAFPVVTATEVAERLARVPLAEATPALLRDCLVAAVDSARYWQEPDGHDVLAGSEQMRAALARVAEHVADSVHTLWWTAPVAMRSQWVVDWEGAPSPGSPVDPVALLREARERDQEAERTALRERPEDPTASWSGDWWSRPPWDLPSSAGELWDGSPAGLWFVEDSLGWERAETQHLGIRPGVAVYEIDSAHAWARLCARFPCDVTGQKRHDWYRTTGRAGRWVIPDWAQVAEHYGAVHLPVAAYLSAAGTVIPVGEGADSVIAGWDPDQTYWFTPDVRRGDEPVAWTLDTHADDINWVRSDR